MYEINSDSVDPNLEKRVGVDCLNLTSEFDSNRKKSSIIGSKIGNSTKIQALER